MLNILFNLNFSRTCLPFLFLARHVKFLCQSDNLLLDECKVGREERKREVTEIKHPPLISFRFRGYFNQLFCCIPRFFKNRISVFSIACLTFSYSFLVSTIRRLWGRLKVKTKTNSEGALQLDYDV